MNNSGELVLKTSLGEVKHGGIYAYQTQSLTPSREGKSVVPVKLILNDDGSVGFYAENYDKNNELIIDPLVFSTFVGGSSSDLARAIKTDGSGNIYITGYTFSSNYPTTSGAYDQTKDNGSDIFISKMNSNATALVFSTFVGGNSSDEGAALDVDGSGNIYITGQTLSSNFPTTAGAYDQYYNDNDAFVTKLSSSGSNLLYSTYLGGSSTDYAYSIEVDGSGNAIIAGMTQSTNFPTTEGAFDRTKGQIDIDIFVTKLNSIASDLIFSTFIGGSDDERAWGLAIDQSGYIIITGQTVSTNFPTTNGAYDRTHNNNSDAFIT